MKKLFSLSLIISTLVACQPEPDDLKLLDEFVVSTNFDPLVDFDWYNSYTIPTDTIGYYSNRSNDTIVTYSQLQLVRPILQQVNANLAQRGYQRVSKKENPDIAINVLIVNDINLFQQVVYPGYYYPYYSGYYGYGSGYYYNYPMVQTYANNTGALVIEVVDMKNRTPDNKVKVVWSAYMGDLISAVDRQKQCMEGIDQAFSQSPYFAKD